MNIPLLVNRIILGKLYFTYNNTEYYYLQPNNTIKYEAELLYSKVLIDNLYESWTTSDQLPIILKSLDLWTNDDEQLLTQTNKKLDNTKLALYNNRLNKKKVAENKKNIQEIKNSLQKMHQRKNSLNYLTVEEYANIKKNEYIFLHSIFNGTSNNLVFSTIPSEVPHMDFDAIVTEISQHFISIEDYKTMARSEYWKGIWNSNKYNVFNRAACDLTDEQKSLINISTMYDRIYEHPECPEEFVIEDDDMLDGWMTYQKNKLEQTKKENSSKDYTGKHGNAQEIFVVGDSDDVDNIYGMNASESRSIIKQRSRAIATSNDGIDEVNLPDVQRNLLQRVNTIKR